jgi:hypothetical protein
VPRTYNQNYAHVWEEIDINCVDILSTLKDRRLTDNISYEELVAQSTTRPFSWFFGNMDLDTTTVVIPNYPDIDYVRIAVSHDMGGNILLSMGETSGVLPQGY